LNIDPSVKPRKQKLRKMSDDKVIAVKSKVQRLLDATIIREVMYPKWLANTVPVKKKNGKWRMCIDFTDLNKDTPKDNYPLPRMDQVVDSAANATVMSLLDYFSGYHQCCMATEDEEKTSFITPFGTFCFVRMPEGLKNASSTFTRMIGTVFKPQIGRNIQAYVDNLIVKSANRASHVSDLAETFANMRRAGLKLNPEKCVFGVMKGKILGCLVSAKRIESNPDKIRAIREMEEPKTKKDLQKLNGRVAALNKFISRSAERSLSFFKALKGKGTIEWGPEQSKAFAELKEYIEKMAILSPPSPSEPLLLYVASSKAAVSAALVREVEAEKGKLQCPVYFVSEALSGSKLLYSELEKIAYAVIMATQKLRHYFEAHKVTVLTDQPLNDLFINKEASSKIAKWATELSEHTIDFGKRSAIKSQVLADFIVDWTSPNSVTADEELVPVWEIRCDGARGRKGAGITDVITSPTGIKLRYAARLDYKDPSDRCTNNTTEYEALLLGLRKVRALGASNFLVKCDAKVIKDHVEKESEAREPKLVKYLAEVCKMERHFRGFTIEHLPSESASWPLIILVIMTSTICGI
jgi:ribonuclease HI